VQSPVKETPGGGGGGGVVGWGGGGVVGGFGHKKKEPTREDQDGVCGGRFSCGWVGRRVR